MARDLDKLRKAVADEPQNAVLHFELAKALAKGSLDDGREAMRHLQQARRDPYIREEVLVVAKQVLTKLGFDDRSPPPN